MWTPEPNEKKNPAARAMTPATDSAATDAMTTSETCVARVRMSRRALASSLAQEKLKKCIALWAESPALPVETAAGAASFLVRDPTHSTEWLKTAAWLFSLARAIEPFEASPLKELFTSGFDLDQIWEQIHLINDPLVAYLERKSAQRVVIEQAPALDAETEEDDTGSSDLEKCYTDDEEEDGYFESDDQNDSKFGHDDDDDFEMGEDDAENDVGGSELDDIEEDIQVDLAAETETEKSAQAPKRKRSVVDDDFFSLEEMERFADMAEKHDISMARKASRRKNVDDEEEEEEDDDGENKDGDVFSAFDSDMLNTDLGGVSIGNSHKDGAEDEDEDDEDLERAFGETSDNANEVYYRDFFESNEKRSKTQTRRRPTWQDREMSGDSGPNQDEDESEHDASDLDDKLESKTGNLFDDKSDGDTGNDAGLSTFEKQQAKMQRTIEELEAEAIREKPWALKGEVSSSARPINSLLEESLDFENAAKPVPVITEETTMSLQDVILQRIKDQAWDDVERKAPPRDTQYDPNRRFELMDEKNSKSLAQVYEDEYVRQRDKGAPTEKEVAVQKQHDEINQLFQSLAHDLDALSNWHYTPKPATLELEVLPPPSVPAIQMEEVTPAAVSDATLVTPKEVYDGKVAKSQSELDAADKRRLRLKAKRKAQRDHKAREKLRQQREAETGITSAQAAKQKAVKQLMGQKNVTIVKSNTGLGSTGRSGKKENGKSTGTGASIVHAGGKVGANNIAISRPSDLRL